MPWTRDMRLLAGAVFLSSAGDLLARIVLALHVYDLTGSGLAVSALVATTLVPVVAVAPLAGLVADRFESVRVLLTASLMQAVVAAALGFSTDLVVILALSSLLTVGNAFGQPAEFTLIPAVAGHERMTEAAGLLEAARYAGFAAGPLLAAGLAAAGTEAALLVNAASFLAIAAAVGLMHTRRHPQPAARAAEGGQRARDGFLLLWHDRVLRTIVTAATSALLFISASMTVEVFYAKDVLHAGDTGYALLTSAWTIGMVVGAIGLASRVPRGAMAVGALVALGVQGAGMALQVGWAVLPVALAGYLVGGLGHGVKNALIRTVIQRRVPDGLHGRVFAAYNAARNTMELGALGAGGVLVTAIGPRAALLIAGLGPVVASLAGLTVLRRRRG